MLAKKFPAWMRDFNSCTQASCSGDFTQYQIGRAAIDRNILRIATWEFAVSRETPIKVAINEAVELAKLFGSDNAPRFINGVLGSLADHEHELSQQLKKE